MSWRRVAELDALPVGEPVRVDLDEPVCVVRLDGEVVRAVHDICSHQFAELHEGYVDGEQIECSLHGAAFDLTTGEPDVLPATRPIPTYATRVSGGAVWVDTDQQTNDAPVPRH